MQRLEAQWEEFRKRTMHPMAPPTQVMDMKSAFFAGALIAFNLMNTTATLSEQAGCALLDKLSSELESFFITNYAHLQKHDS
jgi:hypothetical protein